MDLELIFWMLFFVGGYSAVVARLLYLALVRSGR